MNGIGIYYEDFDMLSLKINHFSINYSYIPSGQIQVPLFYICKVYSSHQKQDKLRIHPVESKTKYIILVRRKINLEIIDMKLSSPVQVCLLG